MGLLCGCFCATVSAQFCEWPPLRPTLFFTYSSHTGFKQITRYIVNQMLTDKKQELIATLCLRLKAFANVIVMSNRKVIWPKGCISNKPPRFNYVFYQFPFSRIMRGEVIGKLSGTAKLQRCKGILVTKIRWYTDFYSVSGAVRKQSVIKGSLAAHPAAGGLPRPVRQLGTALPLFIHSSFLPQIPNID